MVLSLNRKVSSIINCINLFAMSKTIKREIIKKKVKTPFKKEKGSKPNLRYHLLKEVEV